MIDFKGAHYPRSVILYAVYFFVRYGVSYRDLEEIMSERGVSVDHATLNRWVVKYSPLAARAAQKRKANTAESWRMDETYVKVRGEWVYLYRAVDRNGQTLDFMLSAKRDTAAAKKFFANALYHNGIPKRVSDVRQVRPVANATALFSLLTIFSGGTALFGGATAKAAVGDAVPFVLWFNFLAGFVYLLGAFAIFQSTTLQSYSILDLAGRHADLRHTLI